MCMRISLSLSQVNNIVTGITVWLSALFLVKEENAQGDLSEGETVKVRSCHSPLAHSRLHFTLSCPSLHQLTRCLSQATVKVDYGPRKLVTLIFFYPSQAASRKLDSPLTQGTEV